MNRHLVSLFLFSVSFVVAVQATFAGPITMPTGLNPGEHYRLVFVTSTTRDGTSADIADYNAFVTTAANAVPELFALGTTWKAIASTPTVEARDNTGTDPVDDSGSDYPIYRLDDVLIATGNADLWDSFLLATVSRTEDGSELIGKVWTGTLGDGTQNLPWVLGGNPNPFYGDNQFTNNKWMVAGNDPTGLEGIIHLYALSDVLTVVPEPSTIVLAFLAAAGLALSSLRRSRRGKP